MTLCLCTFSLQTERDIHRQTCHPGDDDENEDDDDDDDGYSDLVPILAVNEDSSGS